MKDDTLLELAERCEKATGPNYDLFEDAFALCFPGHYMPGRSGFGPFRWEQFKKLLDAGGYLDAAMTLVPEGYEWGAGSWGNPDTDGPWAWCDTKQDLDYGKAATPALALCAAALRARAQQVKHG